MQITISTWIISNNKSNVLFSNIKISILISFFMIIVILLKYYNMSGLITKTTV